ncbi:MAG: MSHA biogenesis protein MshE [Betaproteobacteria bacterium RIFCSPLOWO2_12_FULL_65_14]|nr:MAG: MSHA biogenesis protein MshE [Betaproteobacteria bacterium RIFCSPLOWO2_12_FULL_65_14]
MSEPARAIKISLGDVVVAQKVITPDQLAQALEQQKRSGRRLGRILVESSFCSEEQLAEAVARQLGVPHVNLKFFNLDNELVRRLPESQARRFRALVLEDRRGSYLVGMADPSDLFAQDELGRVLKRPVEVAAVAEDKLLQSIDRVYRRTEEISGLAKALEHDLGDTYVDFGALGASVGAEDAPVVRLLQTVFEDAIQVNASDVHVEPQEGNVRIRFRIDGVLQKQAEADTRIGPAIVQRLKLMAGLDISEKRHPQDGRMNIRVREQPVDVRLSTMPVQYGESVVMRLLTRKAGLLSLDNLGMPADMLQRFRRTLQRSNGMVLVTGPTGSGKTTTLYAALTEINSVEKKIITVEDPVEYRLPGVNQVQVNEKIDLSFSAVLRSSLRQDPDIILIGEMRDEETAQIGLRAALTGHLVLSTLHTKDAATTPMRLIDMGAPYYMVGTSVHAVIAQRLVRLNCESCSEPHEPQAGELGWLATELGIKPGQQKFKRGRGCSHCNGLGLLGRTGIYEMLEMTHEMVAALNRNQTNEFAALAEAATRNQSLKHYALQLALAGRAPVSEVIRVASELGD